MTAPDTSQQPSHSDAAMQLLVQQQLVGRGQAAWRYVKAERTYHYEPMGEAHEIVVPGCTPEQVQLALTAVMKRYGIDENDCGYHVQQGLVGVHIGVDAQCYKEKLLPALAAGYGRSPDGTVLFSWPTFSNAQPNPKVAELEKNLVDTPYTPRRLAAVLYGGAWGRATEDECWRSQFAVPQEQVEAFRTAVMAFGGYCKARLDCTPSEGGVEVSLPAADYRFKLLPELVRMTNQNLASITAGR